MFEVCGTNIQIHSFSYPPHVPSPLVFCCHWYHLVLYQLHPGEIWKRLRTDSGLDEPQRDYVQLPGINSVSEPGDSNPWTDGPSDIFFDEPT